MASVRVYSRGVARYFDVHPQDPQPRAIAQAVKIVRDGGLIAYPTDSVFALGCLLGNAEGKDRIRAIRHLDDRHHFTLLCRDFAQLGQLVQIDNAVFRAIKAVTPGRYTFILPATKEVPRRLLHARKKTVGVRIPNHPVAQALLAELGEPLLTSSPAAARGDRADDRRLGHQGGAGPRGGRRPRLAASAAPSRPRSSTSRSRRRWCCAAVPVTRPRSSSSSGRCSVSRFEKPIRLTGPSARG